MNDSDLIISMLKLKREIMVKKLKTDPAPSIPARALIEMKIATYNEIIHMVNDVFEDFEVPQPPTPPI